MRMVFMGLAGMRFSTQGIEFQPMLPGEVRQLRLHDLPYRQQTLNLTIIGAGIGHKRVSLNGQAFLRPCIDAGSAGPQEIFIQLA